MDKKLATKWIKALRSGKFKQGRGQLIEYNENSDNLETRHCCLGVLGTICGLEESHMSTHETLEGDMKDVCGIVSEEGIPTIGMVKIRKGNKYIKYMGLAAANDHGVSFESIATWIEKNYKLL